jgi:hypothetical protein
MHAIEEGLSDDHADADIRNPNPAAEVAMQNGTSRYSEPDQHRNHPLRGNQMAM